MADEHDNEILNIKTTPTDTNDFYKKFPREMAVSFENVTKFSRDLNVVLSVPEIVVIGKSGHGKTSVIEALVGIPFLPLSATLRPLIIHFINTPDQEKPVVTVKKDSLHNEINSDIVVTHLDELPQILQKYNTKLSSIPIQLEFKSKTCDTLTVIDTPGLKSDASPEENAEREKISAEFAKQTQRFLLCVENATEWDKIECLEFAKKFDLKLTHSVFVFTKFYQFVKKFNSSKELNQFFSKKPAELRCFFVSLFSSTVRDKSLKDPATYSLRVCQAWKYDLSSLDGLKFDKRYDSQIGLTLLVNYFREIHWRTYKDVLPELKKQITLLRKNANEKLQKLQDQYGALDISMLKPMVNNYTSEWNQVIQSLMDGSNEGNLQSNGQTWEEETTNPDFVDWITADNNVITIHPFEHKIRAFEIKLYGGPQLERLLSVFRAVLSLPEINDVTDKELEEASAVNYCQKKGLPEIILMATHIVRTKIHKLRPLVQQLCANATAILRRLVDIALFAMEIRYASKRGKSKENLQSMQGFPYFNAMLRDYYYEFLESIKQKCLQKCLEELSNSDFIYWEDIKALEEIGKREGDPQKRLKLVVTNLMKKMVEESLVSISMKCHHYFVVLFSRDISGEIVKHVSSLDDKVLEDMFELSTTKQQLQHEEAKENSILSSCQEKEQKIRDLSSQLLRFKLV